MTMTLFNHNALYLVFDPNSQCLDEEFSFLKKHPNGNFAELSKHSICCREKICNNFNCSNLGNNEKKIHQYLANLSKAIGFVHDNLEIVSLYDLPGILSTPTVIAGENFIRENLPQSFVYTKCQKDDQIDLDKYSCCLLGWEKLIDKKFTGGRKKSV